MAAQKELAAQTTVGGQGFDSPVNGMERPAATTPPADGNKQSVGKGHAAGNLTIEFDDDSPVDGGERPAATTAPADGNKQSVGKGHAAGKLTDEIDDGSPVDGMERPLTTTPPADGSIDELQDTNETPDLPVKPFESLDGPPKKKQKVDTAHIHVIGKVSLYKAFKL